MKQLCLPKERIDKVLNLAHDAAFAGHMALKTTKDRIKLNFWFPNMEDTVKEYCASCDVCQRHAPPRVAQRTPITPIPRNDEVRFGCLVADCIGPIVTNVDPTSPKPEYNYALVAVDQFSRWPMAYPLKALTAKATCDAYMQIFTTFGFPKKIRSDNGSNFNSKLTQEFLHRMGCSPCFGPVARPESQGLVERCNATLKTMIYKLAEENPRGWHKLLPYVLWSLRERPSATTHVSPYTLVYGTLPKGPLSVLSEEWAGKRESPLNLGASASTYLDHLRENLEMSKLYAEYYSDIEQQRYATHYNLRSMDRRYEVGDKVIIQSPETRGAKKDGHWTGPAVIAQVKSPYTYIVEIGGKSRLLHANRIRKYNERIQQALVNNCSILFEKDEDFGHVEAVGSFDTSQTRPSAQIDPNAIAHLTVPERKQLCDLLDRFPEIFSDKPGFCPLLEHTITVSTDFRPKSLRAYKVPELLKPEVEKQIRELLALGIIVPSHSEMSSPVVCIVKKGGQGGLRLAIDYRYVNKFSAGDAYPTPDIQEVLQKVGRSNFISCFDARQGYYQIGLHKDSRWLSAFVCDAGLFEFVRLPFGLKSASNSFIRCMSKILHPIRDFTETFVDDMAVHSMSWPDHMKHLEKYLKTIQQSGLTLNIKKSSFARRQTTFVGHLIGSGSIEPDPLKIAGLGKIPQPQSKKDIRRLIVFFSYFRNFIPNLAETARILTDLTQKSVPAKIPWRVEHQNALDKLTHDLNNAVCLQTIDYSREFGLSTDASDKAVGCCLFQTQDDGTERPICFASSKLDSTQARWSTVEREAFAVIYALKKFRNWIFMSRTTLYSDHNPLTFLTASTPTSAKLARWALALQDFDIVFKYRPGSLNIPADLLSRL